MFNRIIAILLLVCSLSVQAQQKPIRIVVAFGAGGLTDIQLVSLKSRWKKN